MGFVFYKKLKKTLKIAVFVFFLFFVIFPSSAHAGVFGYLSEFWDSITEATSGTIEFFQSIGNAVAGAIGNIFLTPLKVIFDFFWTFKILYDCVANLVEIGWSIFTSFFSFIGSFIADFFSADIVVENTNADINLDPAIITAILSIPLMPLFFQVIGYAFIVLLCYSTIKKLIYF
jgi:hypothetical protein